MTSPSERVVGLDLSLNGTGVAVIHRGRPTPEMHWLRQKVAAGASLAAKLDRFISVCHQIEGLVAGATLVCVEDYAYGINRAETNCVFQLGELGGAVRYHLFSSSIPFAAVPIAVGKKYASGNGRAKKDQVARYMAEAWGIPVSSFPSDDCSDALSLATMAAHRCGWQLPQTLSAFAFRKRLVDDLEITCKQN